MAPGKHHRRHVGWIVLVIALLILAYLGYHYRGHIRSAFGIITDATGSKKAAVLSIALAVVVLVCVVFWMILPILVYFGLRDLQRRTAELNESAQSGLRLLAAAEGEKLKSSPTKSAREEAQPTSASTH